MNEKYEKYKAALGWTEEDVAEFFGYKSLDTFNRSSGREEKIRIFVELFELVYRMLMYRLRL